MYCIDNSSAKVKHRAVMYCIYTGGAKISSMALIELWSQKGYGANDE